MSNEEDEFGAVECIVLIGGFAKNMGKAGVTLAFDRALKADDKKGKRGYDQRLNDYMTQDEKRATKAKKVFQRYWDML